MALRIQQLPQFQLTLTPALRLSLEVLQMPLIELQAYLTQQMEENPVLEMEEPATDEQAEAADRVEEFTRELDDSFRDLWRHSDGSRDSSDDDFPQHDGVAKAPSLYESLLSQLRCSSGDQDARATAERLLMWLDPDGYLRTPLDDVAKAESVPLIHVEQALPLVQQLDPPGVGARNLPECLLIQLRYAGQEESLAARIVREHFPLFAKRKMRQLATRLEVSAQDLREACREIARLNPRPARNTGGDSEPVAFYTPDLIVREVHGEWQVELNDEATPRLNLSGRYRALLRDPSTPPEAKQFIRQKIRQAVWLMKAVNQRQVTLLSLARTLLALEHEYFTHGVSRMKPLTQDMLAQALGCHASTVSRAVAGKTMQTPHGIVPLSTFFGGGIARPEQPNSAVSPKAIQAEIQRLIDAEDSAKPLSDQALVSRLRTHGFPVARRTVAKYRAELKLLPAHLRKRCF